MLTITPEKNPLPYLPQRVYFAYSASLSAYALSRYLFPIGTLSMLQLNDQHPAVHSIWVTKSRVIPTFPSFSTESADTVIGDFRPIRVMNNDNSSDEDLDVSEDDDLESDDPLADEDSSFDDFDDEFDDDFQEEESDPDWEHPDDLRPEAPPPSKSSGGKK